jgi:hypothetical protein
MATKKTPPPTSAPVVPPVNPPKGNSEPIPADGPQFGQPAPSPDPTKFVIKHGSDTDAYNILDKTKQLPRPFPVAAGVDEPILTLAQALGKSGASITSQIQKTGQIVFHSVGDTGNTKGPDDQNKVSDKMVSDYSETDPRAVPSFFFHLGDVVYSFGESQYYYDQFYDPYREYPAPIFALAGNHDGMVAPKTDAISLAAFRENFCTAGQKPHRTPEAGELLRTAQIQPGVYFTLEAPFVRILAIYSNTLEDPGIISSQGGKFPDLSDAQLTYLTTALTRIKTEKFAGAVILAVHHPPYVATNDSGKASGHHGNSPIMLKEIDACCQKAGIWPHAVLCAHAHNYQRFTRRYDGRETPFVLAGNGGHGLVRLTKKGEDTLRVPADQPLLSNKSDKVTFENYDDQDFGYLRLIANPQQLRIEYHPASDGAEAKTPDDSVTVDLASQKLAIYTPLDGTANVGPKVARSRKKK